MTGGPRVRAPPAHSGQLDEPHLALSVCVSSSTCHSTWAGVRTVPILCVSPFCYLEPLQRKRVRTCPKLHAPQNGQMNCSLSEISYKTVCLVTCDEGYELEGPSKLSCLGNSQWDGKEPKCVELHCPVFEKSKDVTVHPHNCGLEPSKSGAVCRFSCPKGFLLSGVREELRCLIAGRWSENVQKAFCKDIEAPKIICPSDIETATLEHQNSANISWQIPDVDDNSGDEVSIQVTPAFIPPYLFSIGEVSITYTAADKSGNQASCTFNIKVIDIEPPVIDKCRSPLPVQVAEKDYRVTWEEPQFSDNSGAALTITQSHLSGDLFPKGETIVQYTATDSSGNNRTCELHIIIRGSPCEIPFTPVNGDFICTENEMGVNCTLRCMDGYDFTAGSDENYYCAYKDGIWNPPYSTEWPDCSCKVPSFCNDVDDIDCRLEDSPQKHCLEYNYDYENGFAIGPGGWGAANRLDYSYDDFLEAVPEEEQLKSLPGSVDMAHSRIKRHKKMNVPMSDHKIKLVFNITASVPLPAERNDTLESENQQRLLKALETITNRLKRTLNKDPMYSFQFSSELLVADTNSLEAEKAFLFCRPGSVLRGRMCVPCPAGEFSRSGLMPCHPCPRDYYQPDPGKSYCLSCPFYGTTTIIGARSITDCSKQSSGFNLDFDVSGIYGYVLLDGVLPSLNEITCAFWMKSTDTTNYGTPISYAVENGSDNAFLLTDYNGWVLYVNGKESITDCPSVNDGNWHHIAVTWTAANGAWRVYIDGKLSDGGGGALVLGQEQDQKGEGFNPAESFVGSISQLNIWDYILSPEQVKSLAISCPEELQKGNVLAWPDFLPGVVGRVKIDPKSIFCAG
ncbi:hypothetical protein lerEdw1_000037 [Lerista edwardsae]|nr:hypothetical protein lerEdw1_000037 [Lerista edwardsae]